MFRRQTLMLICVTLLLLGIAGAPLLASLPAGGMIYTSGEDIAFAQSILNGAGYLERGDYTVGRRDRATKHAIADFQRLHRLGRSGRLDFDTMAMLSSHEPAPVSMTRSAPPAPEPPPAPAPPVAAAVPPPPPPAPAPPPPAPVVVAAPDDDMEMPATASPLPLLALSGALLVGLGLLMMLRRPV